MANKRELSLDHNSLNLIRIVIGSYFMAIAVGVTNGFDSTVLLKPILADPMDRIVGNGILFCLSILFMSGLALRMTSLMLAMFVLASSLVETFFQISVQALSYFWRDVALVCAVLLCYSSLRPYELRKAALVAFRSNPKFTASGTEKVIPRRVRSRTRKPRRPEDASYERVLRPLIAPTGHIRRLEDLKDDASAPALGREPGQKPLTLTRVASLEDDDDCDNIFSNI